MYRRDIDEELDWAVNKKYPDYEFSERGDVWDDVNKRYLKISYPMNGTPTVGLRDRTGKHCTCVLAKAVLEAFSGPRDLNYKVDYKDGNKRNADISNLRWRLVNRMPKEKREWVPGHPEISFSEYCRNTYIKVKETGMEYDNIWEFVYASGEKESIARRCMREPYQSTSKGLHIIPVRYDDGCVKVNLEEYYE